MWQNDLILPGQIGVLICSVFQILYAVACFGGCNGTDVFWSGFLPLLVSLVGFFSFRWEKRPLLTGWLAFAFAVGNLATICWDTALVIMLTSSLATTPIFPLFIIISGALMVLDLVFAVLGCIHGYKYSKLLRKMRHSTDFIASLQR